MVQTHRYGPHPDQAADLHLPAGDGPFPVAMLLHGGLWSAAYDRTQMGALAEDLAGRGWAAWNVEYRGVGAPAFGGWPQTGADVCAALDHLAIVGEPLRLDRVVAIGHSAGGQLALWLGARRDGAVRVRAVIGQAPVCDLERAAEDPACGPAVRAFLGGGPHEVRDRYLDASPAARLPLGVPQLLVQGEADDLVPAAETCRYTDAARAGGDRVSLVLRWGDGHFEHLDPGSVAWAAVCQWLDPFS